LLGFSGELVKPAEFVFLPCVLVFIESGLNGFDFGFETKPSDGDADVTAAMDAEGRSNP
jgi:hypothetical protein